MALDIVKNPDPILRKVAEKIKDPMDPTIQKLIKEMLETLKNANGVGLAAPQVGQSMRLCVIDVDDEIYVLINPQITAKSKSKYISEEGCLSIPGEFYLIERYDEVKVRYLNQEGKQVKIKARGLLARAMQHEIDHLDGILFIDHLKKSKLNKKKN